MAYVRMEAQMRKPNPEQLVPSVRKYVRKRKAKLGAIINISMFVLMIVVSISGILLGVARSGDAAPAGGVETSALTGGLLELWVHMHIATSIVFLALITAHL